MCEGALALEVFRGERDVEEGLLRCTACARVYPVIGGIPRLVPDALARQVAAYHGAFFRRHRTALAPFLAGSEGPAPDARARTLTSYSYQWRKFKEMLGHWEAVFRESIAPIEPAFFAGKRGLDAGCGFGRSLYYAASYGAEMIGLDLSEAVESARANTRHLPNAHVVQGDIFHPPVPRASLDFVYSIGVLHHLHDPEGGFRTLTRLLAPGAPMFVWVYARGRGRQIAAFSLMRALSTRLPLRALDAACLALAASHWLLWIAPHRALRRFGPTRALADRIPFSLYARYPFRVLHTDWFDGLSVPLVNYYRPEDIAGWYRRAGLTGVSIAPEWGGRALGYAPAREPAGVGA
jgi:SAM-dependent methyltransferase